jgi:hypothetical protein
MTLDAIIFLHRGDSAYLQCALAQARRSNPDTRIVLLGDDSNGKYSKLVEYHRISDFMAAANAFRDRYIHLSSNAFEFEFRCFERWFVIWEFCKRSDVQALFCADSDVLIYSNLQDIMARFGIFDVSLSLNSCAHASYWTIEALRAFCEFVTKAYTSDAAALEDMYRDYKATGNPGGICDMTLLNMFGRNADIQVIETTDIIEGAAFDHNLNCISDGPNHYVSHFGAKKLLWRNDLPYGQLQEDSTLVRFDILHFQGIAKNGMTKVFKRQGQVFDRPLPSTSWLRLIFRVRRVLTRVLARFA